VFMEYVSASSSSYIYIANAGMRGCSRRMGRSAKGGGGGPTPGSLIPQSPHLGGLPRFLMCWYWSFPPGVLTTRTLLERVLYLYIIMNGQPWPHICGGFCVEKACRWW